VTLPAPVDVDKATASYDNGVLTVVMPKRGARTTPPAAVSGERPAVSGDRPA
jgi:HSP20 family molecular chaperone IbpA